MMRRCGLCLAVSLLVLVYAGVARANVVEYVSQHPVPANVGGGFCYINVPHVHDYPPADVRLYRETRAGYYFVGDPVPHAYDGPRYSYYGPHPVTEARVEFDGPVYCYIQGPHFHWYQPPARASFEFSGGAYWYVGTFPPAYYQDQPRYVGINEVYGPMPYARPAVDVHAAPGGFHGEIVVNRPGLRTGAVVGGSATPPPPMPSPAPAVQVGVDINIGGGPIVVEQRGVVERRETMERHDHHHLARGGGPLMVLPARRPEPKHSAPPRNHHGALFAPAHVEPHHPGSGQKL